MTFAAPATTAGEWIMYRFYDLADRLLYIGITMREALTRWLEHLRKQPWAREIAAMIRDPRTWATERAARAAERGAIRAEQPAHNDVHNHGNPHRVVVRRPDARPRAAAPSRSTARPARRRRGRAWWRRRSTWIAVTWLVVAVALWAAIGGHATPGTGAGLSSAVSTVLTWAVFKR